MPKAKTIVRVLFVIMFAASVAALPVIIWDMWTNHYELHYIAWVVAGGFTAFTIPLVLYEVASHLENYRQPKLQRQVIRILWMPAIYAIDSWLALRFKEAGIYLGAARDAYEAWTIYAFYSYLTSYLEGDGERGSLAINPVVTEAHDHPHMFPCCCVPAWSMANGEFVRKNQRGVLQYSIIQLACAIITFATQYAHKFHDGEVKADAAWPYIAFTINLSQAVALYCLVYFYHSFSDALAPINPLRKFLVVKAVVFFTFWQDMLLTGLVQEKVIKQRESWSSYNVEEVKDGIQNFVVCIEMFFATLAHAWAFPVYDYREREGGVPPSFGDNLRELMCVDDVADDICMAFGCVNKQFSAADVDTTIADEMKSKAAAGAGAGAGHDGGGRQADAGVGDVEMHDMAPGDDAYFPRSTVGDSRRETPVGTGPTNPLKEIGDVMGAFIQSAFGKGQSADSDPEDARWKPGQEAPGKSRSRGAGSSEAGGSSAYSQ